MQISMSVHWVYQAVLMFVPILLAAITVHAKLDMSLLMIITLVLVSLSFSIMIILIKMQILMNVIKTMGNVVRFVSMKLDHTYVSAEMVTN